MNNEGLKKFTTVNFLNFALGFLGLQFAWQMRIILSGPVTENLGADAFLYGLIWLAGSDYRHGCSTVNWSFVR